MHGMLRDSMGQESPTVNTADITLIFCASHLCREMQIVFVPHTRQRRVQAS
jgi:hypothetical protein